MFSDLDRASNSQKKSRRIPSESKIEEILFHPSLAEEKRSLDSPSCTDDEKGLTKLV